MDDAEFRRELDRRLDLLADPAHPDPARTGLPGRDLTVLAVLAVALIAAMLAWGYPW
ncbi:hypothetical protein [Amycolatopsis cihanbeyliensis]|uniref:DUF3040 family protein n=1 Tax=Amycolatopsis cihanbeyliensis TaxID=1128664 RepID=A0A542DS15_AMYCI|nr:hypothetical protein [Amycolatopsis cihanbeyliensis]TQJ05892.1 hypothetical protein FB471_5737 [Amycolatopsis cihanbeyliensis]